MCCQQLTLWNINRTTRQTVKEIITRKTVHIYTSHWRSVIKKENTITDCKLELYTKGKEKYTNTGLKQINKCGIYVKSKYEINIQTKIKKLTHSVCKCTHTHEKYNHSFKQMETCSLKRVHINNYRSVTYGNQGVRLSHAIT